jgi:hypothetical protein
MRFNGQADVIFLMGYSATPATMRELIHTSNVRLFDFVQGDGYVRRFRYLTKLELPPGSLDLGKNTPTQTLTMVAPTVELLARPGLHPALSDLLIQAAKEVHGRATVLQKAGEFPAPLEHEYRVSEDATRYYQSAGFAYRHLPSWRQAGRPVGHRAGAARGAADPGPADRALALQVAHQPAHLPPLRRADGA